MAFLHGENNFFFCLKKKALFKHGIESDIFSPHETGKNTVAYAPGLLAYILQHCQDVEHAHNCCSVNSLKTR